MVLGIILTGYTLHADLNEARQALKQSQPQKATEVLRRLQAQTPADPWLAYNLGVAAYAARDFDTADTIWQELATRELPEELRDQVWVQIGNVSFRKSEPLEEKDPQTAMPLQEQSREAYRIFLVTHPKDKTVNYNLKVVELRLARIHARLASQLLKEVPNKSLEQQIEIMQAALDHQRTAQNLDPKNTDYTKEVQNTEQTLAVKYAQKAAQEEQRVDSIVRNPNANNWEREHAAEQLGKALSDFQQARALDDKKPEYPQGEQRVIQKLAQLLAQEGQEKQREAQQMANGNLEQAIETYEQALEKYEQALELDKNQPIAAKGEPEVKNALEQLNMRRGDQQANEGRQQKPHNLAEAADKMMDGLSHYQEALKINPENADAPPKIDALKSELPAMLNELGKKEQELAARQESQSIEKAISHLEKAATSFDRSQDVQKDNNEPARQGEEQTRKDLARLRQQLAQQNQQKAQEEQARNKNKNQDNQKSFNSLLYQARNEDKQREYEQSRRTATQKYDTEASRIYKNW
jgi:tetratricopeptide (TPR) repeat protein